MKIIQLEIEALSPLAISRQKPGGSISEVEDYIPGSVIRGAMAAVMLRYGKPNIGDDFHRLFMGKNPAIFQNAYPAIFGTGKKVKPNQAISVIPSTALSSKTNPGFKSSGKSGKKCNGVFDTLIDRFCAECYGYPYDPNCPTDNQRVDSISGFYTEINRKYHQISANKRLLTRVGINRRRATSEESILYSIEVLNESQPHQKKPALYRGYILLPNAQLEQDFIEFIQNHSQSFRLGGSTSRGLGKVKIDAQIQEYKSNIVEKMNEFNSKLRERWKTWQQIFNPAQENLPDPEQLTYFTIDLQSDAILTEQWQRTTVISEKMLQDFTGVDDSSLKLEAAYSSYDYRSGWNSAWGLMKDVELITNKGAVYLFSTNQKNLWISALEELEYNGVGDRTCEGFGQVEICHSFHRSFQENPV